MTSKIQRSSQPSRTICHDDYECYRHLLASIMYRAFQDARGRIESSCKTPDMVMIDAALYFEDGRYAWHAELLGIDPAMRPDWKGER